MPEVVLARNEARDAAVLLGRATISITPPEQMNLPKYIQCLLEVGKFSRGVGNLVYYSCSQFIVLYTTNPTSAYCFLLSAPSFCMPSQPTRLPAFSSIPPKPWLVSRFALADFIASIACSLSCTPDDFHASLPVTLPIVSFGDISDADLQGILKIKVPLRRL
jgi:hypothetical protein